MKPSFAIVGCGKVGAALGKYLSKCGYPPSGFTDKNSEKAQRAAAIAGFDNKYFKTPWEATRPADIVFITTPDGLIEDTCRSLTENGGIREKAVVLHCSGALPSTILDAVKACGAYAGSMHPLQSFATETEDNPFSNIMMAVEGNPEAIRTAQMIASDLGALPFIIKTEGKTLYHASAVIASNYLITLMALAFELLEASGVEKTKAFDILKPLICGTLTNIENVGIPHALTGPIARGDHTTVAAHISEIAKLSPGSLLLYKTLGKETIRIALAKGTLSQEAAEKILNLLK